MTGRTQRIAAWTAAAAAASLVALGACVATQFADGQFSCDPKGEAACPSGLLCAQDGFCRVHDTAADAMPPTPDGARGDATQPTMDDGGIDGADACSTATWSLLTKGRAPYATALADDGRLFVGGQGGVGNAQQVWLAELDACDGGIVRETLFDLPASDGGKIEGANVSALLSVGKTLQMAGGAAAPFALFGSTDETTLTPAPEAAIGVGPSGFGQVAMASDGAIWVSGLQDFVASPKGWVFRQAIGTTASCEAFLKGNPSIVAGPSGSMYAVDDGALSKLLMIDSQCNVTPTSIGIPTSGTQPSVSFLLRGPTTLYVVGNAHGSGSNTFVFLSAIDLTTGKGVVTVLDPNSIDPDFALGGAMDSKSIFLGVNQRAGFATGAATIYRYDLPITARSVPAAVSGAPFGSHQIAARSVAVQPAGQDGVFLAATTLDGGTGIARCRKSGQCAP